MTSCSAEGDSWLQRVLAESPQRVPGRRHSAPTSIYTTPSAQRPPLRTRTPSVKNSSRQGTPMQRREGKTTTPRSWAERRSGGLLGKENDPFTAKLRLREEAFEKTIQEWVAWREQEMESLRKLETDLKRQAERMLRKEISLIAREEKLKRREASLTLREAALQEKALQQEHRERNHQTVEKMESRGRLQYMENEIQQLRNIVTSIQQNRVAVESSSSPPQQQQEYSVKRNLHRSRTTSTNASSKSGNIVSKDKQQSRYRNACTSMLYRSGK
ncbi:uncharacterized protein TM35_000321140 [Trypanosoma theileri]|uniref:Trichohyalin n=1 Tax=Trypanosoma theileri TaxID=67003 RepID=A0A1X0NNR7_9TRYP|nr:uncharacterized protein TM35_000321140 [Trypanosoma theileri]ORC85799.1 hypothetical protein TM35_000321140 [Trypanosoma theileri]